MTTITTFDEFKDYVISKSISPHRLAKVSGYSRTFIRNCLEGISTPRPETLEELIEAVLEIGETVTFSRSERMLLHKLIHYSRDYGLPGSLDKVYTIDKPESMSDKQWQEFLDKLS
jgi:predicted transcriptional regulator